MENHVTSDSSSGSQPLTTTPEVRQRVPQLPPVDAQQNTRRRRRNLLVMGMLLLLVTGATLALRTSASGGRGGTVSCRVR